MNGAGVPAALAVAALAGAAALLGRALAAAAAGPATRGGRSAWAWAADALGGLAALHLLLLALDSGGMRWTRATVAAAWLLAAAAAVGVAGVRARRAAGARSAAGGEASGSDPGSAPAAASAAAQAAAPAGGASRRRPGWGDLAAAAAVVLYGALAWTRWIATPDFVYHWGVKGRRYHLAGGIDWAFLTDPLGLAQHPDYPNLVPDLYAAAAAIAGRFDERAQMLWSVLLFALLLPAACETWRRLGTAPVARQLGIAAVAAAAAMFGIGYRLAGGGDWNLAVALAVALPPLVAPAAREDGGGNRGAALADDLRLGFAAAFAAASKLEGMPLAAILIALHLGRRMRAGGAGGLLRAALPAALPAALVAVPWWAASLHYGLLSPTHPGALDPARAATVLPALAAALSTAEWHGIAWLLPLLLPALAWSPRTRPLALACALQLAFYLWIYLASPLEPRFYVLSSFPRLLFHVVPAALIGAIALLATAPRSEDRGWCPRRRRS